MANKGFSLIEVMVSMLIIGILGVALSSVFSFVAVSSVRGREQTIAANLSQKFFVKLNAIPYPYVFALDSSSSSYGLSGSFGPVSAQVSTYPYISVFNDFRSSLVSHKFSRFTLDIRFVIRDLGDLDGDSKTTDLRYFTDSNSDLIDDYDSAVRYLDQNGDTDYRDTYSSPEITEEPHTRLKEATLKLYKAERLVFQETQLLSWEKFTGAEGKAAGATLPLVISTPTENSAVYALTTSAQQNSFSLVLSTPYPDTVKSFRGDSISSLRIVGETVANATFSWKLNATTNTTLDTCTADYLGNFDCSVPNLTSALTEGQQTIWGQAYKNVYYSPWSNVTIVRDINPPSISSQTPTGATPNLRPTVRATFVDNPVTAGRTTAGVNTSVMKLFHSTTAVSFEYDPITTYATWIDSTTGTPPQLSTGSYTIVLEGGDNAKYSARSTWTFTIDIGDFTDNSAPSVSNKVPSGIAASNPPAVSCEIKDNQSGINIETIVLKIDGTVVVSSVTGNTFSACSPLSPQEGYQVSYTPGSALSSGSHTATVIGDHWATSPTNKITTEETWSFNIP